MPNELKPSAWLVVSSPPGGGEETSLLPKKKKKVDACALPDLFGLPFLDALMRASRRLPAFLHCRSTYYVVYRCPCVSLHKKKKTTHESYNCYAASMSLYLLFVMD